MGYPGTYTYVINAYSCPYSDSMKPHVLARAQVHTAMRIPSCFTPGANATVSLLGAHAPDFLQTDAGLSRLLNVLETDLRLEVLRFGLFLDNAVELIDLLERQSFGLVDHEPDEGDADEAEGTPDLRSH